MMGKALVNTDVLLARDIRYNSVPRRRISKNGIASLYPLRKMHFSLSMGLEPYLLMSLAQRDLFEKQKRNI